MSLVGFGAEPLTVRVSKENANRDSEKLGDAIEASISHISNVVSELNR
jgi:hypothetical protein